MKACLVLPPLRDFYLSPARLSALGLKTLVPILRECGWKSEFLNFPLENPRGTPLALPEELDYLKPFLLPEETGPLSWFTSYRHFGPSFSEAAQRILESKPDLVLISAFAWAYAREARETARAVKNRAPEMKVVMGGAGCTVLPEYFLEKGSADFVFTGEAEPGFRSFLDSLSPLGIPNLFFPGSPPAPRVDSRPEELFPVWSEVPSARKHTRQFAVSLSRGCPRGCRFCSNHLTHGHGFRTVPLELVLSSLNQLPEKGAFRINFEDDNLLFAPDYFLSVVETIKRNHPDFYFTAENGLDYTLMDLPLLKRLQKAGLVQLNISLAAAGQETANREKRFLDWEKYEEILAFSKNLNIPVITYFICGLEGDSPDSVVKTLARLTGKPTSVGISLFYPVPGLSGIPGINTPRDFLLRPPGLCAGSSAYPWTNTLSTRQMLTAFRLARLANLLKKRELSPGETEIIHRSRRENQLYTLIKKRGKKELTSVLGLDGGMIRLYFELTRGQAPLPPENSA